MGISEIVSVPLQAPPLARPVIFDQLWTDLAFLHWAVDPAAVAPLLPPGTRPDCLDGATYVGLIPFRMRRAGPFTHLPVPYFGDFLETNVRLYSVDDAGRHGVVFRSLESSRLAVALFARLGLRLPYTWARMAGDVDGPLRRYRSRRRWPRPEHRTSIELRIGAPTSATELDDFLTARWGLHAAYGRRTIWIPNRHEAWPLYDAQLLRLDDELLDAAGVRVSGPPTTRVLWSPGVHSYFGRPTVL